MKALEYMIYALIGLWMFFVMAVMYVISAKLRFWRRGFDPNYENPVLKSIARLWRKLWD